MSLDTKEKKWDEKPRKLVPNGPNWISRECENSIASVVCQYNTSRLRFEKEDTIEVCDQPLKLIQDSCGLTFSLLSRLGLPEMLMLNPSSDHTDQNFKCRNITSSYVNEDYHPQCPGLLVLPRNAFPENLIPGTACSYPCPSLFFSQFQPLRFHYQIGNSLSLAGSIVTILHLFKRRKLCKPVITQKQRRKGGVASKHEQRMVEYWRKHVGFDRGSSSRRMILPSKDRSFFAPQKVLVLLMCIAAICVHVAALVMTFAPGRYFCNGNTAGNHTLNCKGPGGVLWFGFMWMNMLVLAEISCIQKMRKKNFLKLRSTTLKLLTGLSIFLPLTTSALTILLLVFFGKWGTSNTKPNPLLWICGPFLSERGVLWPLFYGPIIIALCFSTVGMGNLLTFQLQQKEMHSLSFFTEKSQVYFRSTSSNNQASPPTATGNMKRHCNTYSNFNAFLQKMKNGQQVKRTLESSGIKRNDPNFKDGKFYLKAPLLFCTWFNLASFFMVIGIMCVNELVPVQFETAIQSYTDCTLKNYNSPLQKCDQVVHVLHTTKAYQALVVCNIFGCCHISSFGTVIFLCFGLRRYKVSAWWSQSQLRQAISFCSGKPHLKASRVAVLGINLEQSFVEKKVSEKEKNLKVFRSSSDKALMRAQNMQFVFSDAEDCYNNCKELEDSPVECTFRQGLRPIQDHSFNQTYTNAGKMNKYKPNQKEKRHTVLQRPLSTELVPGTLYDFQDTYNSSEIQENVFLFEPSKTRLQKQRSDSWSSAEGDDTINNENISRSPTESDAFLVCDEAKSNPSISRLKAKRRSSSEKIRLGLLAPLFETESMEISPKEMHIYKPPKFSRSVSERVSSKLESIFKSKEERRHFQVFDLTERM